jgi:hypothetical protein
MQWELGDLASSYDPGKPFCMASDEAVTVYTEMDDMATMAKDALQSSSRSSTSALLRLRGQASAQALVTAERCAAALNTDLALSGTSSTLVDASTESSLLADSSGLVSTRTQRSTSIGSRSQPARRRRLLARALQQSASSSASTAGTADSKRSWSAADAIVYTAAPTRQVGQGNEPLGGMLLYQV